MNLRTLGATLRNAVREHGYIFAHAAGLTDRQLMSLGLQFGELWDPRFQIQDIHYRPDVAKRSAALDRGPLPPHCECAYEISPPRYLFLYCDGATRSGGEFFLVPMNEVLARLRPKDNLALRTTPYEIKSPVTGVRAAQTLITGVDDVGDVLVLSPMPPAGKKVKYLTPKGADHAARLLLRRVADAAADPSLRIVHRWRRGDLAVIDNARFLHGREGFSGTARHLKHLRISRFTAAKPLARL
jgi:alpha-ketoglutarate-dependent taurine dioxygenase